MGNEDKYLKENDKIDFRLYLFLYLDCLVKVKLQVKYNNKFKSNKYNKETMKLFD